MKIEEVILVCIMLCGWVGVSKLCVKIVLVKVYFRGNLEKVIFVYVIIDEQSNCLLVRLVFFDFFGIFGFEMFYMLLLCLGNIIEYGRRCLNFIIEFFDLSYMIDLFMFIECDQILNIRDEILFLKVVEVYSYLKDIVEFIFFVQESVEILLFIGRDLLFVYYVLE